MSNNLATLNPFDIFIGLDGKPLNSGYIYVGVAGQDPELNPVQLFWDTAGTLPATQPLRTLQGYLANAGAPARIAVNGNYSVRVRDKNGQQVYFEPNVLLTSSGGVSGLSDNGGFIAQLITAAGFVGYRIYNQAAARIAEFLHYGSGNAGANGIGPGMAGINTPAGVDFSIGVNDGATILRAKGGAGFAINKTPVAGKGALQLQGAADGGLAIGNVDNTDPEAFDFYKEGTWTPALKMGGLFGTTSYSSQLGFWTRIGNRVFFDAVLQINVYDGSVGGLAISATVPIPYAALAGTYPVVVSVQGLTLTSPGWLAACHVSGAGAPDVSLRIASAAGSVSAVAGTNITLANAAVLSVQGSYRVA